MRDINDYYMAYYDCLDNQVDWRDGQAAYNVLYAVHPALAVDLRGSEFDPFYDDSKRADFFREVNRRWDWPEYE